MKKTDREEEALAALRRLDQQSERILGAPPQQEAGDDDKIEILGKRIARVLSMIILAVLIAYLWRTYFSG